MDDQELAAIRHTYDRLDAPVSDLYLDARRLLAEVDRLRAIETAARDYIDNGFDTAAYGRLLAAVRGDDTGRTDGAGGTLELPQPIVVPDGWSVDIRVTGDGRRGIFMGPPLDAPDTGRTA